MDENKHYLINQPHDSRFLSLLSLRTPQARSRTGTYLIEGIRHVARATDEHSAIVSLFYDPSILSNRFGQKLVKRLRESGVPSARLSPSLYRKLTLAAEPQGIGAVLRQHWVRLEDVRVDQGSFFLAVESIDSPGNLGTMIRTAEAAGVDGVFVIGANPDPWDPATVRASMGSLFSQRLIRCSNRDFVDWAKTAGVAIVGSSPKGLLSYRAWHFRWPAALLIGAERHGLSDELAEATDFMVRIPMRGRCDSINAAVAAGILLFELSNQRPTSE